MFECTHDLILSMEASYVEFDKQHQNAREGIQTPQSVMAVCYIVSICKAASSRKPMTLTRYVPELLLCNLGVCQ